MSLQEGDSFVDFDEAERHIREFSEYKGFGMRLGYVTAVNTAENVKIIRKRTINCKHSGVYKPKNPEKPGTSIQRMCPWHVNLSRPKDSLRVIVTTLNNNHNHDLSPKAMQFEKDRQFTKEMQQEIEFLVAKCRFGVPTVRRILKEKFPFHPMFSEDLYAEIQKHRPSTDALKDDVAHFYEYLISRKNEDPRWFIEATWEKESNMLTGLFWMSPEQILLWCEFNEVIGHDNTAGTNRFAIIIFV